MFRMLLWNVWGVSGEPPIQMLPKCVTPTIISLNIYSTIISNIINIFTDVDFNKG